MTQKTIDTIREALTAYYDIMREDPFLEDNDREMNLKDIETAQNEMAQVYVISTCKACNEPMEALIRSHHHTENGVDVTK